MSGPIEQKAVAAPATTLIAGYLSGVLVTTVPWLKANLTVDQKQNLPIIIAFLLSALAAYLAPHTHRPDLPIPVQPGPLQQITVTGGPTPQPIIPPGPATPLEAPSSRSPE